MLSVIPTVSSLDCTAETAMVDIVPVGAGHQGVPRLSLCALTSRWRSLVKLVLARNTVHCHLFPCYRACSGLQWKVGANSLNRDGRRSWYRRAEAPEEGEDEDDEAADGL